MCLRSGTAGGYGLINGEDAKDSQSRKIIGMPPDMQAAVAGQFTMTVNTISQLIESIGSGAHSTFEGEKGESHACESTQSATFCDSHSLYCLRLVAPKRSGLYSVGEPASPHGYLRSPACATSRSS
jgi:hypothetical protein